MVKKDVTIYGTGLSGLVAAINLAKEGHTVTMHDKEAGYGGSRLFNPSLHMTPLDLAETSNYIGIDISSAFKPLEILTMHFHELCTGWPVKGLYAVERGDRYCALDTLLYNEARDLGVHFAWKSMLNKKTLASLPPDTIIACGLDAPAYKALEIPYSIFEAWQTYGACDHEDTKCFAWMDECITEYGYYTTFKGMYFDLLFSNGRAVSKEALKRYEDFQFRNLGIVHKDEWAYVTGGAPTASWKQPRLFWNKAVLCGTIAGCIDPFLGFGISGGLVGGKVAALAVTDRARAEAEFQRFTRLWPIIYPLKTYVWWKFIRPHVSWLEWCMRLAGPKNVEKVLNFCVEKGITPPLIPGFNVIGCN